MSSYHTLGLDMVCAFGFCVNNRVMVIATISLCAGVVRQIGL